MDRKHIKKLLEKQRRFYNTGRTLSVDFRCNALKCLYAALRRYEYEIADALRKDLGKSSMEAYMCETGLAMSEVRHMITHVGRYAAEKRVRTPLAQYFSRSFVKPVPYGQVLVMSPWNYPLLLSIDPLADAIAAGNTVILKPGSYAVHTSELLKKMIGEVFPEEYAAVVTGGREENSELLRQDFDYIFFTGSKAVGKEVLRAAAEHLTPVTLELGGKSPCIVDRTADIALAARRIVFGKLLNCGQTCVAPDYIYCDRTIKNELIEAIIEEIIRQYGPDPLTSDSYGRIIDLRHFKRLTRLITAASGSCATIVYGGNANSGRLRIEPTVLDHVTWEDEVMQEEIFGPILPVMTYEDIREAAAEINRREHPLALYIFSSEKANIEYIKNRVQYGGGCINDTVIHLATSEMGFGGVGGSGMGAYHGRVGFETFSHFKSMVDKKTFMDLPIRYQPYSRRYFRLLRMFLK